MTLQTENKNNIEDTKSKRNGIARASGWLIETFARCFVGYVLFTHFNSWLIIPFAVYFTVTGAVLLIIHFFKAYIK